jgi:hypothetical protein
MLWLSVNQTHELLLYAVPMPSLALHVRRGSVPGAPKPRRVLFIGLHSWLLGLPKASVKLTYVCLAPAGSLIRGATHTAQSP